MYLLGGGPNNAQMINQYLATGGVYSMARGLARGVGLKSIGGCFVAGTPVLVPGDSQAEASIASPAMLDRSSSTGQNWLLAIGAVMVGIAAYCDEAEEAKRARTRRNCNSDVSGCRVAAS
jgi:hypothetical protein